MKWYKIRIKTLTDAEDIMISALYDRGLEGAQIEDKVPLSPLEKEQMFVDILPEEEEDDGVAYLNFFIERQEDGSLILNGNRLDLHALTQEIEEELKDLAQFMDIGEGTVEISETEDIDWINNWKEFFHQFYVDDILIIPSWEKVPEEEQGKLVLHIDPGTAFGTGMHETTQLCIRQIRKYVDDRTVLLDVGTGSGILSILSLMFGAKKAVGTDLDPCTVDAVRDNRKENGIEEERFQLIIGNIITNHEIQDRIGYECCHVAVANILADVLLPLAPVVYRHLKPKGIFITSGIIEEKESEVKDALINSGFNILEITAQGEWVSITGQKPG